MNRVVIAFPLVLIAACTFFFFLPYFQKPFTRPLQKPLVAASIFPVFDLVRNVAGDAANVVLIVPPGGEPHTFEPSPSLIRSLQHAEAIYTIGRGIDDWIQPILANMQAANVAMDKGIILRPSGDPHYWLTVQNAKKMVLAINADLQARFPNLESQFQKNAEAYLVELSKTENEIRAILAPAKGRSLITLHDAWYYFADAYGLAIAGTYLPTAGVEPSAQDLVILAKIIKASGAKSLYHEPQFPTETLQAFANDYKLTFVVLDDIGGVQPRDTFIHLMLENAKAIADNP